MTIQLHDTLSRSTLPLAPRDGQRYRFYCCGPTVYGPAHIGNFRTFLVQDLLRRVLELEGLHPLHVRNLTDVDDKTIRRSQEEGSSLSDFTQRWTDKFHADCQALNMLAPHEEPSAVDHIAHQIDHIAQLIEKGFAYAAEDGSVYFRVNAFKDYGKLAHLDRSALQTQSTNSAGAANDADEYERDNVSDFALWKAYKPEDGPNAWDSPWGRGRPGWHIECSAMSRCYLGDHFDLHAGGADLIFPHHENEIAQTEALTCDSMADHWFHTAHLLVDGQKMSKSLGNLYTVDDLKDRGYSLPSVRLFLLASHYRQPMNFTFEALEATDKSLKRLVAHGLALWEKAGKPDFALWSDVDALAPFRNQGLAENFWKSLCDDLNVSGALGSLHTQLKELSNGGPKEAHDNWMQLGACVYAFGVNVSELIQKELEQADVPADIEALAQRRWEAKQSRDFATADALRAELTAAGWDVLDKPDGYKLQPSSKSS